MNGSAKSPEPVIRIGLADDHHIVLSGLENAVSSEPTFMVAGTATNGLQALELARSNALDILVLNASMPGPDIVELLQRLSQVAPATKVIVHTGYPEEKYGPAVFRLGARAYVDKAAPLDDLVPTIKAVHSDALVFSAEMWETVSSKELDDQATTETMSFTPREFQVFLALARGSSVSKVAEALGVSLQTVTVHRTRVLKKLKARTNSEITLYAVKNGFLLGGLAGH